MHVDASAGIPLTSSDPIVPEPELDADASLMTNSLPRQSSPELVQPVLTLEPGTSGMSTHSTDASVSQSTSRSPSQQPIPAKDEHHLPEDIPSPVHPEPPSRRSSEPSVSDQAMMDVDEELLSLVEDRPVRAVPAMPKVQIDSRLPLPITIGQATGAATEQSSGGASDGPSSLMPSSQPVLKGPALMTDEEKDRASMPPPAARNNKAEKDKTTSLAAGTATGSRKKKNGASKVRVSRFITRPTSAEVAPAAQPAAKPKQPPKPRAKPVPKPKAKLNVVDTSSKVAIPKGTVNDARSRSTSVMLGAVEDVAPEPEVDDSDKEDDRLYCVCKTRYDEDRMMIACDR